VAAIDESGNRIGSSYFIVAKEDGQPTTNIVRPGTEVLENVPEETKPEEEEPKPEEDTKEEAKEETELTPETSAENTELEQNKEEGKSTLPTTGISAISILLIVTSAICGLLFVIWGLRSLRRIRRHRGWFYRNSENLEEGKMSERSGRSSLSNDGDLSGEDERLIRAHEFEIPFDADAGAEASSSGHAHAGSRAE
jgi:hypothetical protein